MVLQWKIAHYKTLGSFIQWEKGKIQIGEDCTFEDEKQMFDSRVIELKNSSPYSLPYLLTSSPKFVIIN